MSSVESVAEHFDAVAPAYNHQALKTGWAGNVWLDGYLAAERIQPDRVLDLGSGTGETIETILRYTSPSRVDAVDISEGMATGLRGRYRGDRRVVVARMAIDAFLARDGDPYDLITAMAVWPFSADQATLTQAAADRLAPGGSLIFTYSPLLPDPVQRSRCALYGGFDQTGVINVYRCLPDDVTGWLAACGLKERVHEISSSVLRLDKRIKAGFVVAQKSH
ncbi:MAG TPA: methyltransferase [Candidatus Saccharimonadales bacterium]|nr:methyltransferase [Candidatus Saccharimonadales bacterium]